ncbi:hypothetical protein NM688_g2086 [Phlebia brevispora]|uniref:Uncharacterized protein n=1 Tax=Phlebia brevispora TaxID=194682 RepID=A0ACC1T9H1_9APHY|nr:hypothetical protein NM688_g2086 [Phlebia brevispora]
MKQEPREFRAGAEIARLDIDELLELIHSLRLVAWNSIQDRPHFEKHPGLCAMTTMTSTMLSSSVSSLHSRDKARRRLTTSFAGKHHIHSRCQPLPSSIEALDLSLSSPSPAQVLATIRHHVLSYLADLETSLSVESPLNIDIPTESLKTKDEPVVEEARNWSQTALDMLSRIRSDVMSHLPELHLETVPSVEEFVKSHMPDVARLDNVRARLPAMPEAVRSRLSDFDLTMSDMRSRLQDVRASFADISIDFHRTLEYIPTLSEHLQSLQTFLALNLPTTVGPDVLTPSATLSALLDRVLNSELLLAMSDTSPDIRGGEDMLEKAAFDVARAVRHSLHGARLIKYADLPERWRNNHFVSGGYRFIPLSRWPLLLASLFALHNETLNIHTHLIPFVLWSLNLISVSFFPTISFFPYLSFFSLSATNAVDLPSHTYNAIALLCLFFSAVWHTMSGCAHEGGMELCARVDYVGISWLINASIGSIVFYSFNDVNDSARNYYVTVCAVMAVLGSFFPFMHWFNDRRYRRWRIAFYLLLVFTSAAPLAHLAYLFSVSTMYNFISPVLSSLFAYSAGLVFYATHFPECILSQPGRTHWIDWLGGGSHAIWHVCIVGGIILHKRALEKMQGGIMAHIERML